VVRRGKEPGVEPSVLGLDFEKACELVGVGCFERILQLAPTGGVSLRLLFTLAGQVRLHLQRDHS